MAGEHAISQPRVSIIVGEVTAWLCRVLPEAAAKEGAAGQVALPALRVTAAQPGIAEESSVKLTVPVGVLPPASAAAELSFESGPLPPSFTAVTL